MMRTTLLFVVFSAMIMACNNGPKANKQQLASNPVNKAVYKGMHGKWSLSSPNENFFIEIVDTANVLLYPIHNNTSGNDTLHGTLEHFSNDIIFINLSTVGVRLHYRVKGDTLQEFDEMGNQGTYIKVK